ncbi:type IV secretory system conjugative DNA transfer family protein [Agrobacterium vitis]|uniref:Type IV secretory system conjugative DNA transfer family protein n=1 Tax=Agrobacterium vitis TaxID=373 RepID=A0AAE2RH42_AGRVI|nr:type IV secretory system conjugative DNA transfer family protein [Agrobacterium vitis]MBF2718258.1 type IV secretory system conjugative DNA transfer family protein [Agrobacterium vitis]
MATKVIVSVGVAGLICTLIGASLIYGVILGVVYGDYRILSATGDNPLAPALQLWQYGGDSKVLQKVAAASFLIAGCGSAALLFQVLRVKKEPLGNAAFQNRAELQQGGWFGKKGHVFGLLGKKMLRVNGDGHYVIIGPTGAGKGVGFVIPNALCHIGSMLVFDLKGEIWEATAGYRKKTGNKVFRFGPGQEDTHHYNPLDFIRLEIGNRTTDIQNMASILIPEKGGDNAVWQGMAQQVAAGLISYVLESEHYAGRRHLGEINSLLNCGENLQILMKLIIEKEPGLSRFTTESFNFYIALSEKTAASALTDLQNALKPWKNERIVAATQFTDIDLKLNLQPISIYG